MASKETVAIIGSQGDWGKKATEIFQNAGYQTIGSDTKDPSLPLPKDALATAKTVYASIPPEEIPRLVEALSPETFAGKNLIDNAGEKDGLIPVYKVLDEQGTSICSTHPNCMPSQPLENQTIMIMKVGENWQSATETALDVHQKAGMIPVELPIEDHDAYMDINQYLVHLVNRAHAATKARVIDWFNLNPELVDKLSTVNATLTDLAVWRTLVQKPEMSAQILMRYPTNKRRQTIANNLQDQIESITTESEPQFLVQKFSQNVNRLDPTGEKRKKRLEETTILLEQIANQKKGAVIVRTTNDEAGSLIGVLTPFFQEGISIDSILSHRTSGSIEFHLGIKELEQNREKLESLAQALSATESSLEIPQDNKS